MRRPDPTWETEYRNDRRKARHRCRCCNRIIQPGEQVVMAVVRGNKTWAIHSACADTGHPAGTWLDAMNAWGLAGLKARGWHIPELETRRA